MDQVLGNEHTTSPPIIIAPISDRPIIEGSHAALSTPSSPSLSPKDEASSISGVTSDTNSFNCGQKVKRKGRNEVFIDMVEKQNEMAERQIEMNEKRIEEQRRATAALEASLAKSEANEDKVINLLAALVSHHIGNGKGTD